MSVPIPAVLADDSDQSMTDILAGFDIRHERAGDSKRHYLFTADGCIGHADVTEAWALSRLLRRVAGEVAR